MTPVSLLFDEQLAERLRTSKLAREHRCLLVTKEGENHSRTERALSLCPSATSGR